MPKSSKLGPTAIVTGDVTIDWNLARMASSATTGQAWTAEAVTRACMLKGGVVMLADVLRAATADLGATAQAPALFTVDLPPDPPHPADPRFHHSYAMWEPFPHNSDDARDKRRVWRVGEFLGLDDASKRSAGYQPWPLQPDTPARADLVVLDDAGLGFRDKPEVWPAAIRKPRDAGWIIVKMASPVAQGGLWDHLSRDCTDRLIVVMAAKDLRHTRVHISQELSWERTAQDLFWEMTNNPQVSSLSRCAHVVVSFGTAGALLLSRRRDPGSWDCQLLFDAETFEGTWGAHFPGSVVGQTICLTASLARQILLAPRAPDLARAIQSGVAAMRSLQEVGYGDQSVREPLHDPTFPLAEIAGVLAGDASPLVVARVEDPVRYLHEVSAPEPKQHQGFWTILDDVCSGTVCRTPNGGETTLLDRAEQIVLNGPEKALPGVPLGKFGGLTTADRREIESFRAIRALMSEYCSKEQDKPLSIAVFGPPGSGKSFGVMQVAKAVAQGSVKDMTFNLSQFSDPLELLQALHQVRDVALSGKIPLVFFDEFDTTLDSQPWGWLRCLLAPMQDGSFQEGQITHPIGRAIFVFAGGTSDSMSAFNRPPDDKLYDAFARAKGPDFISRLKGYVNILGPNQCREGTLTSDDHYLIRRAIILRGLLQRRAGQVFSEGDGKGELNLDPGVLKAFLQVSEYRHGVRSMEAIIGMSMLAGKRAYERSSLPSEAQLNVHVNGREFLAMVQAPELKVELLEKLASAVHDAYREEELKKKTPSDRATRTYEDLDEEFKEQNRGSARDLGPKLAAVGYLMIASRGDVPPFGFPGADMEKLAEMEHDRWLRQKVRDGWRYGVKTDRKRKENEAMLPWVEMTREELEHHYGKDLAAVMGTSALPEDMKDLDRAIIRNIPRIVAAAGYTIARLQ